MYKRTKSGVVIRESDGACIPEDTNNTDYKEVLKWVEAGNSLPDVDEASLIPEPKPE